jgi:hypothetical protein
MPGGARRGERNARPSLRRRLRGGDELLREQEVPERVRDVHDLEARCEQLLHCEGRIECLIPRPDAARKDTAHRQRAGEPIWMLLEEAGGDDAAERMSPRDRARGRPTRSSTC